MNELHKALGDISSIRRQMADTTQFRGYGPATLAATALLAIAAAGVQAVWVGDPTMNLRAYFRRWGLTAVLSAAFTGTQICLRTRRVHSGLSDEMIRMAVEQFLPALATGVLITLVVVRCAPDSAWMLPGLWQVIFSLGIFSSCRFLPKPMLAAGAWYLLTGMICIGLGDSRALAPWTMGVAYGAGQSIVAAVLLTSTPEGTDEV